MVTFAYRARKNHRPDCFPEGRPAEAERLPVPGRGVTVWEDIRLDPADIATYTTLLKSYCEPTDVLSDQPPFWGAPSSVYGNAPQNRLTGLHLADRRVGRAPSANTSGHRKRDGGDQNAGAQAANGNGSPHSAPGITATRDAGKIVRLPFSKLSPGMVQTFSRRRLETSEGLAEAKRIVSVGKGIKQKQY